MLIEFFVLFSIIMIILSFFWLFSTLKEERDMYAVLRYRNKNKYRQREKIASGTCAFIFTAMFFLLVNLCPDYQTAEVKGSVYVENGVKKISFIHEDVKYTRELAEKDSYINGFMTVEIKTAKPLFGILSRRPMFQIKQLQQKKDKIIIH